MHPRPQRKRRERLANDFILRKTALKIQGYHDHSLTAIKIKRARSDVPRRPRDGMEAYARGFINETQLRRFILVHEVTGRIGTRRATELIRRETLTDLRELRYCFDMEINPPVHFPGRCRAVRTLIRGLSSSSSLPSSSSNNSSSPVNARKRIYVVAKLPTTYLPRRKLPQNIIKDNTYIFSWKCAGYNFRDECDSAPPYISHRCRCLPPRFEMQFALYMKM